MLRVAPPHSPSLLYPSSKTPACRTLSSPVRRNSRPYTIHTMDVDSAGPSPFHLTARDSHEFARSPTIEVTFASLGNGTPPSQNAQLWEQLLEHGTRSDDKVINIWKDELSNLLIFIGLLSAIITSFMIFSLPLLQPSNSAFSNALIIPPPGHLRPVPTSASRYDTSPSSSFATSVEQLDRRVVQVNVLWGCSLALSLISGFFTISVQQWIGRLRVPPHLTSREAVRLRELRRRGLEKWKMEEIIYILSMVVQLSVILFIAGLALLLSTLNDAVASTFLVITATFTGIWIVMTTLAILIPDCPFKSPIVPAMLTVIRIVALIVLGVLLLVYVIVIQTSLFVFTILVIDVCGMITHRLDKLFRAISYSKGSTQLPEIEPVRILSLRVAGIAIRKAVRVALRVWSSLCFSDAFWLGQELKVIAKQADQLDCTAVAYSAYLVPKEESISLFNRSFQEGLGQLPVRKRVELAIRFAEASLEMRHQRVFTGLWSVTPTFSGNLRPFHDTLYELRDSLWNCLPDQWQLKDEAMPSDVYDEPGSDDTELVMPVLYLMYRSTMSDRFKSDEPQDLEFLVKMSQLLMYLQRRLAVEDPMKRHGLRYPMSMLFGCCIQRTLFEDKELIATTKWAQEFLSLLRATLVIAEHRSVQSIRALSQDSVSDLIPSVISIYETALREILSPLAFILEKVVSHITFQIARITPLDRKSHIFMTVEAIIQIANRLEWLASSGYFSPSPAEVLDSPPLLSSGKSINMPPLEAGKLSPAVSRTDRPRSVDVRRRSGMIEPVPELQQVKTEVLRLASALGRICLTVGNGDLDKARGSLEKVQSLVNCSVFQ
ncbi:hypothetical protein PHLGIDRAFT_115359 [Phlebiopsis gigantea 11061_1 CR5-6]|uniref:DUF6535 domain-containing protein n=1 Tax=Phlebiopsis gigantea (strain 11061_1 CR5-6) TaxID=745531 RepID=A0A0C3SC49_PHLG1|nr:hypothetical protein PHLGIDRAFT_115359 [Phlebiopsis gigantea 11061_1 CR5-6]